MPRHCGDGRVIAIGEVEEGKELKALKLGYPFSLCAVSEFFHRPPKLRCGVVEGVREYVDVRLKAL